MNRRLLLRWAAWCAATLLAAFLPALGLGFAAWKAAVVGGCAALIPAVQNALLHIAATGKLPPPPADGSK